MIIPPELYTRICEVMPIPCIDILVTDHRNHILLIKRNNEPAKGEWWFPGGRVYIGETREQAVVRKLKEECSLKAARIEELGTFDVILPLPSPKNLSHGITTVFHVDVDETEQLCLDDQSRSAEWRTADEWLSVSLPEFIRQQISNYNDD